MSDYDSVRKSIELKFEEVILEIMSTTNPDGFKLLIDEKPLIAEFNKLIESAERCFLGDETVCVWGDKQNED